MIKKVITAALVTVAASQADAAVFNGFAVGANAGIMHTTNEIKVANVNWTGKHLDKTVGVFGIQFDYDKTTTSGFYWGLGLDFDFYTGKYDKKFTDGLNTLDISYKYNWSSEFDVRLGYNFCKQTIVYGLFGVRAYEKKSKVDLNSDPLNHKNETRGAPVVGLGVKTKLSDKISGGVEYRYAVEKNNKYVYNGVTVLTEKIDNHSVLARVSYHF